MMISPVRLSASLGLAWAFAGQQAAALATRLGLGPLGMRAFLPRAVCQAVDAELKRLETMVRRILFLIAMETPLPEAGTVPLIRKSRQGAPPPAGAADARVFGLPAFRLTETSRSPAQKASRLAARLAARARYEPGRADPEARPGPQDLVPAKRLMNRFAALEQALSDPEAQLVRFRRKLARIRADKSLPLPIADEPPAACTGLQNTPVLRDLFWTLHDAALTWLPVLDSG
ncbi:hypothetical protein [Hyphomonas sp.]|uniref:hypothetical protein n=1 Tax=Hyphomonas sp. TaxID=87 RepID=UPI000C558C09|nr:hypothetical protein [Hyphomonas sp.]MAB09913.1 hypothetical protein [Hyphomonas sp.]MAU67232.1 hypothetical protein [Hyphomonas sp.]MBM58371.1 hypothetical protein [Hyphomonas sp.]